MTLLNQLVSAVFTLVLRPLQLVSPNLGVGIVSLGTAILVLLVVKATSDPRRITAARSGMYAAILEMRLFNDDLRAILHAQLALLKSNAAYVRASLVPMLWLILPLGLLITQLDLYYGRAAVAPGQSVLVKALLRDDVDSGTDPHATLASPPGIRIAVPGIWFPSAREVVWHLSPQAAGEYDLRLRVGTDDIVKSLGVSNLVTRLSPGRFGSGFLDQLRHPSEPPLPGNSIVKAIVVGYPDRYLSVFGRQTHWGILYGVLSILFVLALAPVFGVAV